MAVALASGFAEVKEPIISSTSAPGSYFDRTLKTAKPAGLPLQERPAFSNNRTAVLGLTAPPLVSATGDEVIE
jgi:hypothetical protein